MTSPLRLLLWLKWTLTWRGYRRSRAQVVSAILLVLILLPLSGFCAYGVWFLVQTYPFQAREIARDALAVVYLVWVVTPLLGFSLNESYDLTKLFVYPVSVTRIVLGSLLGGLLDRAVLLILPVLGVLLTLFSPTPLAFLASLLLLLLFLLHTLALGQALMLLLIGFLRSRRFRDVTIVLFPLLGMTYYIGQRLLFQQMEHGQLSITTLLDGPAWRAMTWLPPGWAAAGLDDIVQGNYGTALGALLALAAAGALTLGLAVRTLKTLYTGDVGPLQPRPSAPAPRQALRQTAGPGFLLSRVPGEIAAMAAKEWTYFQREPQYKAMAVQTVYTLVLLSASIALPSLRRGGWGLAAGDGLLLGVSGALLLSLLPLLFNIWAGEGAAVTVLFSLPTPRRALLLGKNLAHGALLLAVCAVGLTAVAAFSGRWGSLPIAGLWVVLAAPLLLAAGNLVSVRFPHRMLVRGQRWQRGGTASAGDGSGCAYALLYALAYGATILALLPVLAAVWLPGRWGVPALWYALSLPLAAAYSGGLYVVLLKQSEVWLLAREPEIVQKIVPGE